MTISRLRLSGPFALLCLLAVGGLSYAESDGELTQRLWQEIQGKPNPRLMDNFEVLEGFPLLVNGPGISPEATVLTAVVCYDTGSGWDTLLGSAFEEALKRAEKETGKSGDQIAEELMAMRSKRRLENEADYLRETEARKQEWKTKLVRRSCLLQPYMRDADNISGAFVNFRHDYFLDATMENQDQLSWEKLKEAIDKKIPVILGSGDSIKAAVGYYTDQGERYVLVYDPAKAEYRMRTGIENVPEGDRKSKDPRIQKGNEWLMKQKFPADHILELKGALPPGIRWCAMTGLENSSAIFVYDWRSDLNTLYPELLKRLGIEVEYQEDN